MKYTYYPQGTCSQVIEFEIVDGKIHKPRKSLRAWKASVKLYLQQLKLDVEARGIARKRAVGGSPQKPGGPGY